LLDSTLSDSIENKIKIDFTNLEIPDNSITTINIKFKNKNYNISKRINDIF
jgi:hypothetical protein